MSKKIKKLPQKLTGLIGSSASLVIHTILFVGIFVLRFFGVSFNDVLLLLTTLVSLEAIYLSILIQLSVNQQLLEFKDVSKGINEIQEDFEDLQKDVEEIVENTE